MNTKKFPRSRYLSAAVSAALSFAAATAHSGPQNGVVTNGAATIRTPDTHVTQIDQATNSVSIDWQTFDVAANESVNFNQPSANAVALNRILTQDPSQILGSINANGRIFLLNPNGIIFGASARVNVGSLVASSLDLTDADAADGRYSFATAAERSGAIVNDGTITAGSGGSITLLGGSVLNNGLILADYGTVNLGAGRAATLSFDGDGLMRFQIDAGLLTDANGVSAAVTNNGEIAAAGGQVLLTAQQAGDVVAQAVNNEGVVRAARVENVGGVIRLVGSGGTVINSGTLDATGSGASTGGTVHVLGERAELSGTTSIDVSGSNGGGTALIGGSFRGEDPAITNARQTTVADGAVIRADSTASGNAGQVVIWSDGTTRFHGDISARALGSSGDGGNVEVSGHEHLGISGHAWLDSANGRSGRLLLDPGALTIVDDDDPDPPQSTAVLDTVNDGWVNAQLATGSLDIFTTASGNPSVTEDLTVEADAEITWIDAGNTLRLEGGDSIVIDGTINGAGPLTLVSGGTIALGGNISVGGVLDVTAGANITQSSAVSVTGAANFTTAGGSSILLGNGGNAFGGAVTFAAASGTLQDVTLANSTAIDLTALSIAGDLNVTAASGSITQAGTLSIGGSSTFTADAGESITLGQANTFTGAVAFIGNAGNLGNVTVRDLTALTLQPLSVSSNLSATAASINAQALTVGGALALTATGGGISQTAAMNVTGNSTFTASVAQSISLDENNTFGGTVAFAGSGGSLNDVTVRDTTILDLQALTIDGDLVATGSALTQSGALSVAQTSTFRANQGTALVLDNLSNALQGPVQFVSNGPGALQSVTLRNSIATDLGASTVVDAFSVTATSGNITQSGELSVGGAATFTAGTGRTIELDDADNSFGGAVNFVGDGGALASITVIDTTALTLQTVGITGNLSATATSIDAQALNVGANLDLTATTGGISQTGALNVTGNSTFTADAGQSIALGQANAFNGTVAFVGNGGDLNDVTVRDTTALALQSMSIDGNLTATAAGVTAQALTVGGDLSVIASSGGITQTAAMNVTGNSTFAAGVGQSIALGEANTFNGSVSFVGSGGNLGNVTVRDSDALTLQAMSITGNLSATGASIASQTLNVGGALDLTATSGGISQTGALNVTGNSTFTADAGQSIALGQANTFLGTVAFVGDGGNLGNVTVRDSNALDLQALALDGDFSVTTIAGAITQSGALDIGGTATFTAATGQAITLIDPLNDFTGVVNFIGSGGSLATVSVRDSSALNLGALTLSGDLSVNAASIAQSGALTIGGNSTFTAANGQSIDVDNAGNTFTGTVAFAASSGTLQDVSVADTTALDLQALTIGGDLTVTAASLTQSGALSIGDAATLTSSADIALNNGGNSFGGAIAITAANASLTNSGATTLAASTLGTSLTVNSTGAINQTGTIDVTTGSATLNSAAAVALNAIDATTLAVIAGGAVTQTNGLTISGNTTISAANQTVTLNSAANAFTGSVALTAANAFLRNAGTTTLGTSTLSNDLTVTSGGLVTQSGALSVTGNTTITATGQDVTLTTAGNALTGELAIVAANASLTNGGATTLASSTIGNDLIVNSMGAVSQSGALSIGGDTAIIAAGQNVTLGDAANSFAGSVAVSGANVTLGNSASVDLLASNVSGDLAVVSNTGTISQSGALTVAGTSTFTAAGGQSILLTDAANSFGGGVTLTSSGTLDNVSLAAASSLNLQGLNISGDLNASSGGALTQSGALVVAGAADFRTLNAGSNITLNGANQFGSVSAASADGVAITQGAGDLNLRQVTGTGPVRLEASAGSIVDDAADASAATVSSTVGVELVAQNTVGTITDLLTRQGTAIAVNTNGGSLAARVTDANGQINLALPGGSAPTAAAGAISAGGSGRLLIQSAGDLSLNAFNSAVTGFDEIGFSADGTLSVPGAQSDLIAGPLSTLYLRGGVDIARADRTFSLGASHLIFDSASQGGDVTLNTSADRIDASLGGSASLTVQDTSDLTLGTVNAGNNVTIRATNIRDDGDTGSVTRVSAGGVVSFDASAGIGEADGVGGGRIDTAASAVSVNAGTGSVYLSHSGDLQIGGEAAAGAIDVVAPTGNITVASNLRANGPLTLVAGTAGSVAGSITLTGTAQSTGTATLTAANGGVISDANDAATHLEAQSASLSAASVGSQANTLGVDVGALSANVGGDLYVNEANAVQLRTISATAARISATGAITDDGDNTTHVNAQSLTLAGTSIGASGVGSEIDTAVDRLSASASAGGIYVGESGDLQLAALSASGTGNSIAVRAEGAISDDGDTTTRVTGGSLALTGTSVGAAGAAIETQVVLLNATGTSGGVFVNEADDLQINTVTGTDVSLTAAGALTDDGNDSTRVTGAGISLNAARIGATDSRIDTAAGSLAAIATAGGIYVAEQDDVALGEVRSSGSGNTVDIRTGGNGNMSVQTLVTQGGAVNLTAGGTGSITVTGAIESNNGVVSLISGNALALPGLDTGTGSVTLRTVNDLNVGTISASSVSITSDTGNVSLGTIDATGGTVTVSANNGTITDGDATSLTARDATLSARSIGGPDQALNLAVDNLTATASAGGIYINDIGGLRLNAIDATGVVSIVTTGALAQAARVASAGSDIEIFADSILMQSGATTLSGNGNISYVANTGAVSLEVLDAGTGRTLVIAADSVYSTLDAASGINNVTGSAVEIRAGGLFGGLGEIGTLSNPISIATPATSGRNVYLIVPAVNGIQTTTPSISYSGSSASLLLKGYTGTTGFLFFDLSSTFSPETILSGDETIVPLANGRVAVNSDSLSAAKQALSSGVITRVNVDWAAFDPNVSLFGTLDPSLRLPADQIDEEVPTASLVPEGTLTPPSP